MPPLASPCILTLNSGSSSLKFAVYEFAESERRVTSGAVDRIAAPRPASAAGVDDAAAERARAAEHDDAIERVIRHVEEQSLFARIVAVGHRLVHGGARYRAPVRVTPAVLDTLRELRGLAPEHLPQQLLAVAAVSRRAPALPQVACFDTAFHAGMPRVAQWYGLPRRLSESGVVRYGFHGLSYEYVAGELRRLGALGRRTVVAHLGNGASMCALLDGESVDTSMGLTPIGGLLMSSRSGDLDPGVLLYLMRERGMSVAEANAAVAAGGGLLGVSETSSDMRDLLAREATDARAADAIAMFCYQARKTVGAYAAALGGLDTLVFTGGIGEHAAPIRARICEGLEHLGVHVEPARNERHAEVISPAGSAAAVRVMATQEELTIARHVRRLLAAA